MLNPLHVLPFAVMAHSSFTKLPSGNGFGTAVYDTATARIVDLREHTYQSVDTGVATRDLVFDTYFGLRAAGKEAWLTGSPVDSAALDGGVITVVQHYGGLTATQWYFAPYGVPNASLTMVIQVKNETSQPIADVHVFTIHNLHLGEGDGTVGQRVDWTGTLSSPAYVQKALSSQRVMLLRPLTPPAHHSTTPQNPYNVVTSGALYTDVDTTGNANDVASGYQYDLGTIAPGASATVGVLLAHHPFGDVAALDKNATSYISGRSPAQLVAAEQAQWTAWLGKARIPPGLSADETRIYLQQLAVLRMAQSREPSDVGSSYLPTGQIIASLRPGHWDIAWVRDGCYAIAALARAGFLDEARAGLEFMLRAAAGFYQQYVGRNYRISVVRYLGKGKEESDSDQNGPNVEFDGFGMFLWAASEYLAHGGDPKFVDQWWSTMSGGIADVLVSLVESPSGLLAADSSIWESHWDNGGRQHYTYSNVWAVVGLLQAATWADTRDGLRATNYRQAAMQIKRAIRAELVTPDNVLRASTESKTKVDAAVVEAFNQQVLDPAGPVAQATLDAFRTNLFVATTGHGYKRNQNGGTYDEREWVVIDLRVSQALRAVGRIAEADALWGWVRDQALANHGLLPELYDQTSADYAGETPMAGFGAGAFVLGAWDKSTTHPSGDGGIVTAGDAAIPIVGSDGSSVSGADGGASAADAGIPNPRIPGCSCQLGAAGASASLLKVIVLGLLLLVLALRRNPA